MTEEHPETNGSTESEEKEDTSVANDTTEVTDKSDSNNTETDKITELEKKIIRQIEYYFGDINLSRDKFLQEQIKLEDGWVHLETMTKFNRLGSLSTDIEVIANALDKSDSGLMEISTDRKKIRRSPNKPILEMNEERRKEIMNRTVYCKGFPKEGTDIDKLLEYFNQFSKVDNVVMRNYRDKAAKTWFFKGSIFVVFPTVESAESFLKLESVKYGDVELIKMKQEEYIDMKRKERMEFKVKALKKGKEEKEKQKAEEEAKREQEQKKAEVPNGCVLKMKGVPAKVARDSVKKAIEAYGFSVAFVEARNNEDTGWVRLDEEDSAKHLVEKLSGEEGKLKLEGGEEVVLEMPTEEEETAYKEKVKAILLKRFQGGGGGGGRGGRRGGRGGRQGRGGGRGWNSRKRKGGPTGEGPTPSKVKAAGD